MPPDDLRKTDWTPSTIIEREVAARNQERIRHEWMALTLGALVGVAIPVLAGYLAMQISPLGVFAFFPGLALSFLFAVRIDRRRARLIEEANTADQVLLHEFGGGKGWFVDLMILQGTVPTGLDRGMLWIEEGRLIFSGHRTSFALRHQDVARVTTPTIQIPKLRNGLEIPLNLRSGRFSVSLSVNVRPGSRHKLQSLITDLYKWQHDEKKRAKAAESSDLSKQGQIPPLAFGPGAPSSNHLLARAVLTSAYWGTAYHFFEKIPDLFPRMLFAAIVCGVGGFLGLIYVVQYWRAFLDRRQLVKTLDQP